MKKNIILFLLFSFLCVGLSAQENEFDIDVDDDFDLIFEDAEDKTEPLTEEVQAAETPVQVISSAFSNMVHFSGNFSGDVGLVFIKDESSDTEDEPSGYFSLNNTLNMTVSPSNIFVLHGSLETGISTGFNINVSSLYFDYLLFNRLYITAGKTSISWGNLRLFNNSDFYSSNFSDKDFGKYQGYLYKTGPLYAASIFVEDNAPYALQIRYPWSFGTLTFATTIATTDNLDKENFNYYGSIEFSLFNTNFNIYAKRPEKKSKVEDIQNENIVVTEANIDALRSEPHEKHEIYGLEVKRTILGFDTYLQGLVRVRDYSNLTHSIGYDYIVGTVGVYRLFDSFDPNIGFNIEYQHEFNPLRKPRNIDRVAFEGGVKRIGPQKNMKVGLLSHYNITDKYGYSGLSFIISGICPYADWTTKAAIGYGSKYTSPVFLFSSAISLSLDY